MRPIRLADLDAAARALMAAGEGSAGLAAKLLAEADLADRYRKHLGRAHAYGNGSLLAAAQRRPLSPQPRPGDGAYLAALAAVLQAIAARRG